MNKKRLSVVMAGAMLASAVAPVMAAEVQKSEVSANETGLLQKELRELVQKNLFANDKKNAPAGKPDVRNQSVYKIYVNKVDTGLTEKSSQEDWQKVFRTLDAGDVVRVYSRGFKEVDGKLYHYEYKEGAFETYTEDELKGLAEKVFYSGNQTDAQGNKIVDKQYQGIVEYAKYDEISKEFTIKFVKDTKIPGLDEQDTMTIKPGDVELKFTTGAGVPWNTLSYYTDEAQTNEAQLLNCDNPVAIEDFYGFVPTDVLVGDGHIALSSELVKEYTITPGGYNYDLTDLYDGLFLTEKGQEFFTMLKESVSVGRDVKIVISDKNGEYYTVNSNLDKDEEALKNLETEILNKLKKYSNGYKVEVKLGEKAANGLSEELYTITGTDKQNMARVTAWMVNAKARVDVLAGDNRYETAVEIAKEYAGIKGVKNPQSATKKIDDIVLVNGNALVDGLAAAPLAAQEEAPVLLTEADKLPTATYKFLKELMADHLVGGEKSAKIHLVGGEAVLSKGLERQLRGLGFDVVRYDGDNREETSLEVLDAMNDKDEVFVVGAQGEADAMSIASVAAEKELPIVVAKNGGISEDATYELKGKKVTIIGGESVVSKADYNAIKAEAEGVQRIAGANRKATNAEIIKKFYKGSYIGEAKNVIVAKDGQRNKMELVDALAAANMAAKKDAPIVLATDKLSKEQENALELNAKKSFALYQVGHGVARDVVKTIAENLGLTNR